MSGAGVTGWFGGVPVGCGGTASGFSTAVVVSGGGLTGILLTLAAGEGAQLTPAAVPIALMPVNGREPAVGVVREGDECYAEYRDCVDRVTQRGYARFPV